MVPYAILSVNPQGVITDISTSKQLDSVPGVEFYSGILIPGMVNTHAHLELSYLKGTIAPGCGFAGFAHAIGQSRNNFCEHERLRAIELYDAKMWREGIAAVGDICNGDTTFAAKARSPIYYHNFIEVFGLADTSSHNCDTLLHKAAEHGLSATITPHSTYSLSRERFAGAVGKEGLLSIHFMESPGENALYNKSGELWQWYEKAGFKVDFLDYGSPTGRIIAQIAPGRKVLLVHNVCTTQADVQMLHRHFAGGETWVLCPGSNNYISGVLPPAKMLMECGMNIAIGTDSLASSHSLSMVEQMRLLADIPLLERLKWATIGGARALGIESWCGSIEVGKKCGVVLLTGVDTSSGEFSPSAATVRIV